jgi:hypothetical protein
VLTISAGLILWGISIDKQYHWIVGQAAFFFFEYREDKSPSLSPADIAPIVAMGLQMGNTVISSYIVDCYPLQSMSVILFYSVFLDISAFINPVSRQMLSRHQCIHQSGK